MLKADSRAVRELYERREIWARKPQIRLCYERWARRMTPWIAAGPIVEAGSGSGLTSELFPRAMLCDIIRAPWLDFVADCMRLPVRDASVGCVLCFDILHHAANPHTLLDEAARVLRPGGRILLMEPWISPLSFVGYKLLHHEDIVFSAYHKQTTGAEKDPWQGNLAMANIVFRREAARWSEMHPSLHIAHRELLSLFDFQLAAGFKPYAYVPEAVYRALVRLDDWLAFLMPLAAFRVFLVLEKGN